MVATKEMIITSSCLSFSCSRECAGTLETDLQNNLESAGSKKGFENQQKCRRCTEISICLKVISLICLVDGRRKGSVFLPIMEANEYR